MTINRRIALSAALIAALLGRAAVAAPLPAEEAYYACARLSVTACTGVASYDAAGNRTLVECRGPFTDPSCAAIADAWLSSPDYAAKLKHDADIRQQYLDLETQKAAASVAARKSADSEIIRKYRVEQRPSAK
jgi:hypothetical protein